MKETTKNNMILITKGTSHVWILPPGSKSGRVSARLFCGDANVMNAYATLLTWSGKTMAGARRWAAKLLK